MQNNNIKILILRVSAIGDVIHTLPAIFLLKKMLPTADISWVVQKKAADILVNQKFIKNLYILNDKFLYPKNLKSTLKTIVNLRKNKWDFILDFQGLLKTSSIIAFLTGKKFGFDKQNARSKFSTFFTHKQINPNYKNIIEKNLSLVTHTAFNFKNTKSCPAIESIKQDFKLNYSNHDTNFVESWLINNNIKNFILLAPNTTWESKHWPQENWIELVKFLQKNLVNSKIVLTGTHFGNQAKNILNFCKNNNLKIIETPKFNLIQMAKLIEKSKLLLAPDTGLLHLADFLQKNAIGIFGPTKAKIHGAYINKFNIDNAIQIECPHYYEKTHGNTKNSSKSNNCMYKLNAETLGRKILYLLGDEK
ncbi:glycosyltransferase family 9 protein [Candidatus Dependentiae bacterium]|nr:glycosyltransferase family 9 protein [Candidatus Dependentiae bacterium]MBU4386994.1 glycosyltransferase family 9 protein [Candidatus Dependentiae bacterium]MCG2756110.1 glycosyltransferase family 9 protein [Candidatus Dependentiae bacterium]